MSINIFSTVYSYHEALTVHQLRPVRHTHPSPLSAAIPTEGGPLGLLIGLSLK